MSRFAFAKKLALARNLIYYIISEYGRRLISVRSRAQLSEKDRRARSRLLRLLGSGARVLKASLVTMERTCGKPTCRCARGEKHASLYLGARIGERRAMIYIPPTLEEAARRWVANGQAAQGFLEEMAQASLEHLVEEKKKRERGRPKRSC